MREIALKVNIEEFKRFVAENFKNKADCAKQLEISRTHLEKILNGEVRIGKVFERRIKAMVGRDVLFNCLVHPEPIIMGDKEYKEIIIKRKDGTLIASITSRDIIFEDEILVECIPDSFN